MNPGGRAEAFVSQATLYLSGRGRGPCQGEVELAETRRWSCEESERGGKWKERVVGKAAGDERVFIPGWQMRPGQTSLSKDCFLIGHC